MDNKTSHPALRCVDCDFTCTSNNEMCRHIFSTRHGARKCPKCDTYIVPRAFFTSLQKLIGRRREALAVEAGNAEFKPSSSPELPSPIALPETSAFSTTEPLTAIAVSTHPHCSEVPNFRCFERSDFALPGGALDFNTHPDLASDAQSGRASASLPLTSTTDAAAPATGAQPFRCMDCLNYCPTWTQVTRHIEQSGHTLPVCVQCKQHLKCFGPLRPPQHEINCGHCGFFGVFYTRRDYRCDAQASRSVYNSANLYTGLFTLQYKCVCGVSFLHPVHLAEHLRKVHHVTCIDDKAVCHCCGMSGTLPQLTEHMQHPCWVSMDGTKPNPAVVCRSLPTNPIAAAAVEMAKQGRPESSDMYGLDDIAAMTHLVEVPSFSGAAFLQFRPLLPPMSDDEVPLIGEAHALASSRSSSPSATTTTTAAAAAPRKPSYVVLYQCRECLFLFTGWDRIVQHIRATRHCRTFCVECQAFLPELLSYSASEGNSAVRAHHQQQQQQQQQQQHPVHPHLQREAPVLTGALSSGPIRSTTLAEHIEHLHRHGNIIGYPVSPETLEVLVDVSAACYSGSRDPSPDAFAGPRTLMVYQCPAQHEGCYKVFLHYGDFVAHILTTQHGTKTVSVPGTSPHRPLTLSVLPTCYPMVTYRAKFTVEQLCAHFDFVQCPYCETAVPRSEETLHGVLCVELHRLRPFGKTS